MHLRLKDENWPKLPEKQAGQHRWTTVVGILISDSQVRAMAAGSAISVDEKNVLGTQKPACVDCDQTYDKAEKECPGEAWQPGFEN